MKRKKQKERKRKKKGLQLDPLHQSPTHYNAPHRTKVLYCQTHHLSFGGQAGGVISLPRV
jgi:hypothetical protein